MLMADPAKSRTGEAYRALRGAIVSGDLPPGARLGPADLARRFGLGPTPIREALARLAAENLAIAIEQRGFRVAPLSTAELRELLDLRLGFEKAAMLRSMQEGGDEWEARILSACHLLTRCDEPHAGMPAEGVALWSQRHDAFHEAILSGCASPWLSRFHRQCVEQIERYRLAILRRSARFAQGSHGEARIRRLLSHAEHIALRDAVLSRDAARAEAALAAHIGETAAVYGDLFEEINGRNGAG
jgi:DNA-binding GntR family transcriptional regulator